MPCEAQRPGLESAGTVKALFGPILKGIRVAASPSGRKVIRHGVRLARSQEGKRAVSQAKKVVASAGARKLATQATHAGSYVSEAAKNPETRHRVRVAAKLLRQRATR